MNSMLLELLAAQASANGNPGVAEAMARMQAATAGTAAMNPQDLLAQIGNGNPLLAMFMKQMTEKENAKSSHDDSQVIDLEPMESGAEFIEEGREEFVPSSAGATEELRKQAESLVVELTLLRERNDLLAAAVGACCLCWGQDLECRSCRGRGGPGFSIPDENLFQEYVVPAIHTFRAQKAKFRAS
jgi:hypothetical protein